MKTKNQLNREGWLTELSVMITPLFKGFSLAKFRVTCGWPCKNATSRKVRRVGECHSELSSTDGHHEIFISPFLAEPGEVSGTLAHEMAHVAAGIKAGHGGKFNTVCKHVGLTNGKPTQAMPGPGLVEELAKLVAKLGAYPHAAMRRVAKPTKPSSAWKLLCPKCGCKFTVSKKWIEQSGIPTCGCGKKMKRAEEGDEDEDD